MRNAAGVIVIATGVVVVGAGAAMTLIDSKEYPNVGVGLWWAFVTRATWGSSCHVDRPAARLGLVRYPAGGLVAGIAFSAALPHFRAALLSALAGAIAAASGGPSGISRRVAVTAAG